MRPERVRRLRWRLAGVGALAVVWASALLATDGLVWHVAGLVISTRNPRTPLALAVLCGIAWLALPGRRDALAEASASLRRLQASRWAAFAAPAALLAMAFSLLELSVWAGGRPLWLDEQMIALNLRERTATGLAGPLWLGQSAPYGWLALQRGLLVVLGTGEPVLRLVSVLHGIGLLGVAAWSARRWLHPVAGAVLVGLCGLGPWLSHFAFELKHYAGDATWALLLPVAATWALEAGSAAGRATRLAWWTALAVVGQWLANGATFVLPACLLVLLADAWWRSDRAGVARVVVAGAVCALASATHYGVSLRHSAGNAYLLDYWWPGFPPQGAGVLEIVRWWGTRFDTLAVHPGGTRWYGPLWMAAAAGWALGPRPLAVFAAAVPASAFVLASLRVAPLVERQALWIVPALYLGVAMLVDAAARALRADRRRPRAIALGLAAAALVAPVALDVGTSGVEAYRAGRGADSNHGLDDRAGVQWLLAGQRPGDVVVTTTLAAPAVWWYGGLAVGGADAGSAPPGGPPVLDVGVDRSPACARTALADALREARRALVYLGLPPPAPDLPTALVRHLSAMGEVAAEQSFATLGRALVVDLAPPGTPAREAARARAAALDGPCLTVVPARRW